MKIDHSDEEKVIGLAFAYLENKLDEETTTEYEQHYFKCDVCQEAAFRLTQLDDFQEILSVLRKGHISGDSLLEYVLAQKQGQVAGEQADIEKHLEKCEPCRSLYSQLEKMPYAKLSRLKQD